MPTRAVIARQTKSGLKQLEIGPRIRDRIGQDLIVCESDQIQELRAEARVLDRVLHVINSILQEEIDGGNTAGNGTTDDT